MKRYEPTGRLNILLGVLIPIFGIFLQFLASRQNSWMLVLLLAIVFSFVYLPLYTLLHEAEHKLFHSDKKINYIFGVWLAAFFPAPFSFIRCCHLGHHARNRTDVEAFDYYFAGQNPLLKRVQFYIIFLGNFWILLPISILVLVFYPPLLYSNLVKSDMRTYAMVKNISSRPVMLMRLESLFALLLHASLVYFLDLSLLTYFFLYYLYGLNWSVQNYIPHAFSPRDITNGAFNLKTNVFYEKLLLHFNWHLAHHQHPTIPWYHLPKFDDPKREQREYLTAFLRFLKGPKLCTEPSPKPMQAEQGEWDFVHQ